MSEAARAAAGKWMPLRTGATYAVCDTRGGVGRLVAENISSLDEAVLIAAAPLLKEACGKAFVVLDDARPNFAFDELADELGVALDASERDGSGKVNGDQQEG